MPMDLNSPNDLCIKQELNMKKPKMIIFDYGQTLVDEPSFDGVKGTKAVLNYAVKNKYNCTAEEIQKCADSLNKELGRYGEERRQLYRIEVPNSVFAAYLYESQGIEIPLTPEEIDRVFWDAAAPGVPTEGIIEFIAFLKEQGIRTAVISNISYCGEAVKERIDRLIEGNSFEFIIATSEYMFRKPDRRIFELALEKADLPPEDVWYIGDRYDGDVTGAKGAGLFPVMYVGTTRRECTDDNVLIAESWKQLKNLILSLEKECN